MKKYNKSKTTRNIELKEYIKAYYVPGDISVEDVANSFGLTVGAVKNFMYRHNITKRKTYIQRNKEIKTLYKHGISVKRLCDIYNLSSNCIYIILNQ